MQGRCFGPTKGRACITTDQLMIDSASGASRPGARLATYAKVTFGEKELCVSQKWRPPRHASELSKRQAPSSQPMESARRRSRELWLLRGLLTGDSIVILLPRINSSWKHAAR